MSDPVAVRRESTNGVGVWVWCPGCDDAHRIPVEGSRMTWMWDGSLETPTFSPSLLVMYGNIPSSTRCHSFIRDGQWQFLNDCHHDLAGQTVPMVPLPDWLMKEAPNE